jgi:RNA 2',3'-cyclic 3'-phosphodiesterase
VTSGDDRAPALRLFVAIEVPDAVRALVESAMRSVRDAHPRGRWVPVENQHVTLKFLGSTPPPLLDWVSAAIGHACAEASPFRTRVDGAGAFPNARRARVLWAGLDDVDGRMAELAGALDEAMRREFAPDRRAFTPHLTVARFEPPVAVGELPSLRSEPFGVERVVLFRSRLRRPAPVYQPVAAFPLGG